MDALDRAAALIGRAQQERDIANKRVAAAELAAHQARRDQRAALETVDRLNVTVQQLEQRVRNAEQVADASRRAMLDHAART